MMSETRVEDPLYFFPDEEIGRAELEAILSGDDYGRKCWAVSHLLRFAQWDDIWMFVSRDEVRTIFPDLGLPETLAQAWARMLKIETPVG